MRIIVSDDVPRQYECCRGIDVTKTCLASDNGFLMSLNCKILQCSCPISYNAMMRESKAEVWVVVVFVYI